LLLSGGRVSRICISVNGVIAPHAEELLHILFGRKRKCTDRLFATSRSVMAKVDAPQPDAQVGSAKSKARGVNRVR
jgi:hypothetical protein